MVLKFTKKTLQVPNSLKVVDSRPALSAGRVKKSCFKTLENFCVRYEGSILSSQVIKIHRLSCGRVFDLQKHA